MPCIYVNDVPQITISRSFDIKFLVIPILPFAIYNRYSPILTNMDVPGFVTRRSLKAGINFSAISIKQGFLEHWPVKVEFLIFT